MIFIANIKSKRNEIDCKVCGNSFERYSKTNKNNRNRLTCSKICSRENTNRNNRKFMEIYRERKRNE